MKFNKLVALAPFIFICLGFLSIVIGAFLFNLVLGCMVLGIALILVSVLATVKLFHTTLWMHVERFKMSIFLP